MRGAHRTLDKHHSLRRKRKYCHRNGGGDGANLKQSTILDEWKYVRRVSLS